MPLPPSLLNEEGNIAAASLPAQWLKKDVRWRGRAKCDGLKLTHPQLITYSFRATSFLGTNQFEINSVNGMCWELGKQVLDLHAPHFLESSPYPARCFPKQLVGEVEGREEVIAAMEVHERLLTCLLSCGDPYY